MPRQRRPRMRLDYREEGCLLIEHLGYACIALGSPATTNKTCRLANATPDRLRELTAANLDGLLEVLRYNAGLAIRLFRVSSAIVPFAAHPVNALPWASAWRGSGGNTNTASTLRSRSCWRAQAAS